MTVTLSPYNGVGGQVFDSNGNPLSGGKIYTYIAGTTTPLATYTSNDGLTPHANPIILNAAGRVPTGEIWLSDGLLYKFVLKDANDVTIATYDDVAGINGNAVNFVAQQEIQTATSGQTVFTLTTMQYAPGTNSLSVFVDGINQYGPGATYAYTETNSTTVTFNSGVTLGAKVKFTTAQLVTSAGPDAAQVTYDPPFSNSVPTNVSAKLAEMVSVVDFGADPTGVSDSATAFSNAIAQGGVVFIPAGTYLINSEITITNQVTLVGEGPSRTNVHRNYSPGVAAANDTKGIFSLRNGAYGVTMRDMTLRSLTGQSGGCLVSLVNTATGFGVFYFENMVFTTDSPAGSTHQYTIYADGTGSAVAPIGIRNFNMVGCLVFGAGISNLLIKGVLHFSFIGGGAFTAGGVATSNVRFDGSAAVFTEDFLFAPSSCTCPISFDRAKNGIIQAGIIDTITNTSNTEGVYGFGRATSVQENWTKSAFFDVVEGLKLSSGQKITNIGAFPINVLEMKGNITGFAQTNSVTKVGQAGYGWPTTVPTGQAFSFELQSGKLFWIATGGGAAALVFADYKSATITLLANPSSEFQASSTPGIGFSGIYKSANDHVIFVKNNVGAPVTYQICVLGGAFNTVDPA